MVKRVINVLWLTTEKRRKYVQYTVKCLEILSSIVSEEFFWMYSRILDKQLRRPYWDCGGWVPGTSWSYHFWQPAPTWRLHWWLAKPDNPAMSPHALDKIGTHHTETQWKAKGGEGREQKPLNAPHIMLLLPAPLTNKPYSAKHEGFHACPSILTPLTLLVVYLLKLRLTSFKFCSSPLLGRRYIQSNTSQQKRAQGDVKSQKEFCTKCWEFSLSSTFFLNQK